MTTLSLFKQKKEINHHSEHQNSVLFVAGPTAVKKLAGIALHVASRWYCHLRQHAIFLRSICNPEKFSACQYLCVPRLRLPYISVIKSSLKSLLNKTNLYTYRLQPFVWKLYIIAVIFSQSFSERVFFSIESTFRIVRHTKQLNAR